MKKTEKKIPVEVYSRIVGYFRPVNQWNRGKQEEFKERKEFTISEIQNDKMKQEVSHGMDDK
jgi:ribonucleoside-triphosphate reductase